MEKWVSPPQVHNLKFIIFITFLIVWSAAQVLVEKWVSQEERRKREEEEARMAAQARAHAHARAVGP